MEVVPWRTIGPPSGERREHDVIVGAEARPDRRYGQNHGENYNEPPGVAGFENGEKPMAEVPWTDGIATTRTAKVLALTPACDGLFQSISGCSS
jgi:hypothetical protein